MQRSTLPDFASAPVGKYVASDTWLHFCASPQVWGVLLWGRPDEQAAIALGQALVCELAPGIPPHASLVDLTRLTGGDPRAFGAAGRYIKHYQPNLTTQVQKMALVRPKGIEGALVAGAFEVLPKPYPVAVFEEPGPAWSWLDAGIAAAAGTAMLERMHAEASSTPLEVGALRALLDAHLEGMPIAKAAKRLGMSQRSLQRKLGESGTTFVDELADARIRAAKRLLLESDAPLTAIAFDVGCGSLQIFSALFRRRTGESPSAFRARHVKR